MRTYHLSQLLFRPSLRLMAASLTASILVAASMLSSIATAQGSTSTDSSAGQSVWCGLWSGSTFTIPEEGDTCGRVDNTPSTPPATDNGVIPGRYVALGDSVAAGLGLPAGGYTTASDIQCGRSEQGYPNIVAARFNKQLINVACSGATAGDLTTKQSVNGPNIPAQLDRAFAGGTPGLMSITAGANDVHWSEFIKACYADNCTRAAYDNAASAYRAALRIKLNFALSSIYTRSHGTPPKVVITGYYAALSDNCAAQQPAITTAEIAWLNSQTAALNAAIQNIAGTYSFVRYAPVNFSEHDICAAQPWIQTQNDIAPFHPTTVGQQVIADAVIAAARR